MKAKKVEVKPMVIPKTNMSTLDKQMTTVNEEIEVATNVLKKLYEKKKKETWK